MPVVIVGVAVAALVLWGLQTSARASARRRAMTMAEINALDPYTATLAQVQEAVDALVGPTLAGRITEAEARVLLDGVQAVAEGLYDDARALNAQAMIDANFTDAEQNSILARARAMGWAPPQEGPAAPVPGELYRGDADPAGQAWTR